MSNIVYISFTAACHSQDRPTAAVTPIQSATPVAYLPHLAVCPQPPSCPAQGCTRGGVAMGCAAASLTPPNVSAASLEGDALRPVPVLTVPLGAGNSSALNPVTNNAALACRLDVKVGNVKNNIRASVNTIRFCFHSTFAFAVV